MRTALIVMASGLVAATASAEVVLTYGFTDLAGSYDAGSGAFRAIATDTPSFATSGDVTRIGGPTLTAEYAFGFTTRSSFADAVFDINVTMNNGMTAVGSGTFSITDDDGDTITGSIEGLWINGGSGYVYFNGSMSNVTFSDNGTSDDSFDGPDGGGFNFSGLPTTATEGAIVGLFIRSANFFNTSFDAVPVQIDGQIVPTPGALALAGLGGLTLARRRR